MYFTHCNVGLEVRAKIGVDYVKYILCCLKLSLVLLLKSW